MMVEITDTIKLKLQVTEWLIITSKMIKLPSISLVFGGEGPSSEMVQELSSLQNLDFNQVCEGWCGLVSRKISQHVKNLVPWIQVHH